MKEFRLTPRTIFGFISLILITIGFTWLIIHFISTIKDEPAEEVVTLKYSKKGLYLYPRSEVLVSNSERPSSVSREQFESLEIGDSISGYMKNEDTFVTEKDIQFEIYLGYVILVFLYLAVFLIICRLLLKVKFINNSKTGKAVLTKILHFSLYGVVIIYLTTGMVFTLMTATNIVHKLNPLNQVEAEATVMGGEYNRTRSHRGAAYTTYELFISYQDEKGDTLITKKAVTGNTYNQYDVDEKIPLTYRKNNVYDTFIQTKSTNEILPAFVNLYTIFIAGYLVSLYFIMKTWRKKRKQGKQE